MSFDLRIQFIGLMTWVPEGTKAMHVLLPVTGDHAGHGGGGGGGGGHGAGGHEPDHGGEAPAAPAPPAPSVAQHHLRLVYDVAYESRSSTQLLRRYRMLNLDQRVLNLARVETADELVTRLPDELPLLNDLGGPIKPGLVTALPAGPVAARVTMHAGALSAYELGATFKFPSQNDVRRMTPGTEWTIRGITSTLAEAGGVPYLPGFKLEGPGEEKKVPNLYPIGRTIHLMVFNTVREEFPPKGPLFSTPDNGSDRHFAAYFALCTSSPGDVRPEIAPGEPIFVTGDTVDQPDSGADPSGICVQARGSLE